MNFTYCDKNLVTIDFEAENCFNEDEVFEMWDMLGVNTKEVPVFQVDFGKDDDEIPVYIYVHNDNEDEYSDETDRMTDILSAKGFDVMVSDEDYGGNDVVIVTLTTEHLQIARDRIEESRLRVCPKCGQRMAHSVTGASAFGERIEQFYCEGCSYGWIGYPSGKFIREGVLYSSWDVR